MKAGVTMDYLQHQARIAGGMALVVAPVWASLCRRGNSTGNIRRECRVPRCTQCRRFGRVASQCVRTYAAVAGPLGDDDAVILGSYRGR